MARTTLLPPSVWEAAVASEVVDLRDARGPMGAAAASFHLPGWKACDAFKWANDLGQVVVLTQISPAQLSKDLELSYRRGLERKVANSCGDPELAGHRVYCGHLHDMLKGNKLTDKDKGHPCVGLCRGCLDSEHAAGGQL